MANIYQTSTAVDTVSRAIFEVNCTSESVIGDWLYNNLGIFTPALATNSIQANVLGLIIEKISSTTCKIRVSGASEAIFSGLDPSLFYFLSDQDAGKMVNDAPTASGSIVLNLGTILSPEEFNIDIKSPYRRS